MTNKSHISRYTLIDSSCLVSEEEHSWRRLTELRKNMPSNVESLFRGIKGPVVSIAH